MNIFQRLFNSSDKKKAHVDSGQIKAEYLRVLKYVLIDANRLDKYDFKPLKHLSGDLYECRRIQQSFEVRKEGKDWPMRAESMIGLQRMDNIEFCVKEVIANNVEGDLIETGVWRGGACIFMRAVLKAFNITNKIVWVADSFQGLPKANEDVFPDDAGDKHHLFQELNVSIEEVKSNFMKYNLLDDQVRFLKGWFKDTMPNNPIEKLSILRLDGDMYESTIDVLIYLYPKLSEGGYCIIDDWGAVPACKKAIQDYRKVFGIKEKMFEIDWTGIFWKKEKQVEGITREEFLKRI